MNLYEQILLESQEIDWSEKDISHDLTIVFPIPEGHPRHKIISHYILALTRFSKYHLTEDSLILGDKGVKEHLADAVKLKHVFFFEPREDKLKTIAEADSFLELQKGKDYKKVIVIGGGVLINFGGYIAEKLSADLVYVPTTITAMCDAAIGGKVRLNEIKDGDFIKHAYKTFYEPSYVVLDPQFLDYLDEAHIRIGLAEVIKHALYQSPLLARYLISKDFDPFKNKESLLRVILWTADLKRICLEADPEESAEGSRKILRAAHDISDKLEEGSHFTIPHGEAVEKAMIQDLFENTEKSGLLVQIYQKLGIGYTTILS